MYEQYERFRPFLSVFDRFKTFFCVYERLYCLYLLFIEYWQNVFYRKLIYIYTVSDDQNGLKKVINDRTRSETVRNVHVNDQECWADMDVLVGTQQRFGTNSGKRSRDGHSSCFLAAFHYKCFIPMLKILYRDRYMVLVFKQQMRSLIIINKMGVKF